MAPLLSGAREKSVIGGRIKSGRAGEWRRATRRSVGSSKNKVYGGLQNLGWLGVDGSHSRRRKLLMRLARVERIAEAVFSCAERELEADYNLE